MVNQNQVTYTPIYIGRNISSIIANGTDRSDGAVVGTDNGTVAAACKVEYSRRLQIGKGMFGTVYEACKSRDSSDCNYVIKSQIGLEQFNREYETLTILNSRAMRKKLAPNLHCSWSEENADGVVEHFLVMDKWTGTVADLVEEAAERKDDAELFALQQQVLELGRRLDAQKIIHGDAKLDNVLYRRRLPSGKLDMVFTDFGLSQVYDAENNPQLSVYGETGFTKCRPYPMRFVSGFNAGQLSVSLTATILSRNVNRSGDLCNYFSNAEQYQKAELAELSEMPLLLSDAVDLYTAPLFNLIPSMRVSYPWIKQIMNRVITGKGDKESTMVLMLLSTLSHTPRTIPTFADVFPANEQSRSLGVMLVGSGRGAKRVQQIPTNTQYVRVDGWTTGGDDDYYVDMGVFFTTRKVTISERTTEPMRHQHMAKLWKRQDAQNRLRRFLASKLTEHWNTDNPEVAQTENLSRQATQATLQAEGDEFRAALKLSEELKTKLFLIKRYTPTLADDYSDDSREWTFPLSVKEQGFLTRYLSLAEQQQAEDLLLENRELSEWVQILWNDVYSPDEAAQLVMDMALVDQNCRVISRESESTIRRLTQKYLAKQSEDGSTASKSEMCRALAYRFATDGMKLTVNDEAPVTHNSALKRVDDRLWVGSKNDLSFVLERIDNPLNERDESRLQFWQELSRADDRAMKEYWHNYESLDPSRRTFKWPEGVAPGSIRVPYEWFRGGNVSFGETVFDHVSNDSEAWVAFITPQKLASRDEVEAVPAEDVEMYISAMTHPKAPWVEHMGIQRSFLYQGVRHARLAVQGHSFIAAVMLRRLPHLQYMFSAPVSDMTRIIKRMLPFNTYIGSSNHDDIVDMNAKSTNSIPIQYDLSDKRKVFQVLGASRKNVLFECFRYDRKRGLTLMEKVREQLMDEPKEVENFIVFPDGSTLVGNAARSSMQWLFHGDLLGGRVINPFIIVDYGALASNF